MPSLTFVLPHWLYWSGLLLFPIFAIWMVRRSERVHPTSAVSTPLAYLFLVTGGFVGIHRFYLRNWLGVLYLPLFAGILYSNVKYRAARDALSRLHRDMSNAEFEVQHFRGQVADGVANAAERLSAARRALESAKSQLADAVNAADTWDTAALGLAAAIAVFLILDAILLPRIAGARAAREQAPPEPVDLPGYEEAMQGTGVAPGRHVSNAFTRAVDAISGWTGYFVAWWSPIAVFVYYYEVVARYVFNSPTNWAHESMFLMFGMQYLIAGAFAYREDAHVRVDVLYAMLPERGKAAMDVFTSVFFFIFAGALLWTGWTFTADSVRVWEVSFTEWAIQYWPVKATITIGALLLLLQGLSRLTKDVAVLTRGKG